jgi:hypothetical protein
MEGEGGEGMGGELYCTPLLRSQIIRRRESLVLYKSLNTLCSEHYVHLLTSLSTAHSDYGLKRIVSFTKITP